ncbi:tRNA lysidine(34) synthetase TilS [Pelagibacteraceae bacterium]|nr:tRNA lysidine(34) synthetase TilS [Pelagibacteraceae bacterium]
MSKKNSNVILKEVFEKQDDFLNIYSSFNKTLNSFKKKTFLIAVSGGPDSLALAALAKVYSNENKCKIYYALVDHNIRKNSSTEAKSVKKLLKKFQLNLNILTNKKKINNNIQSNSREIRYNLLINFCKKKKISHILTAHNMEDQVETFFIRLSRGSGLDGLSSMKSINKIDRNIFLLRPLLNFKKNNLLKISKHIFRKYFKDPSNKNMKYLRTRVRNLQKPLESSGINYNQIFKSINNLASSRDTLNFYFDKMYKDTSIIKKKKISINIKDFDKFNKEIKMRFLNKSIKSLTNSYYSPRSKKIFNLIDQLLVKKSLKLSLGRCNIFKEKNYIIIQKEKKN